MTKIKAKAGDLLTYHFGGRVCPPVEVERVDEEFIYADNFMFSNQTGLDKIIGNKSHIVSIIEVEAETSRTSTKPKTSRAKTASGKKAK